MIITELKDGELYQVKEMRNRTVKNRSIGSVGVYSRAEVTAQPPLMPQYLWRKLTHRLRTLHKITGMPALGLVSVQ